MSDALARLLREIVESQRRIEAQLRQLAAEVEELRAAQGETAAEVRNTRVGLIMKYLYREIDDLER